MIFLALSIAFATGIFFLFRKMHEQGAVAQHAVLVNYGVAAFCGMALKGPSIGLWNQPWFLLAAAMGVVFYSVFLIMARTTQASGMGTASIATKMSLIIPVVVGVVFLREQSGWTFWLGVAVGLASVILTSASHGVGWTTLRWPLLTFLGSGFIDTAVNAIRHHYLSSDAFEPFLLVVFGGAFVTAVIHHRFFTRTKIERISYVYGASLGVVNFGSMAFLLHSLHQPDLSSSLVFSINNIGVVLASSVVGALAFKEAWSWRQIAGLACGIAAILLLTAAA